MKVQVLFFSIFREKTGVDEMPLELSSGDATVSDVLDELFDLHEALRPWDEKMLIAVNCEYADRSTKLSEGDELALMPPVQGG